MTDYYENQDEGVGGFDCPDCHTFWPAERESCPSCLLSWEDIKVGAAFYEKIREEEA
jgi:hypothetical protein